MNDTEYLLDKSMKFPHVFKIVPVMSEIPKTGVWSIYDIDGVIQFLINSSHPEAIEFYKQQIKINKENAMKNEIVEQKSGNELMISAGASIEQSRAVAEAQASMLVAKKFPRDENGASDKIINACKRVGMAESSLYAYKRGSSLITGPTIKLAETMAKYWGNITYGFREISRNAQASEIEVFCWDMENNVRVTRIFNVKHWRDTGSGGYALKTERDKYENIANNAQRRVRACILEMIPGDIVEDAEKQCKLTLEDNNGKSIEETAKDIVAAFKSFGVSQAVIEKFLNHAITAIVPAQVVSLKQIYKSIKDGVAPKEDFFDFSDVPEQEEKKPEVKEQNQDTVKEEKPKTGDSEKLEYSPEVKQLLTLKKMMPPQFTQAMITLSTIEAVGLNSAEMKPEEMTPAQAIAVGKEIEAIVDIENS